MLYYDNKEIPEALAKTIISSSLVKVGYYDGHYHKFVAKGFSPDLSVYQKIEKEAVQFGFLKDDVQDLVRIVLSNVETESTCQIVPKLDLIGDAEIPVFSHIEIEEENNGITHLIYVDDQKFYVLSTTRSTLAAGNVIKAKVMPLNSGACWEFDVYKDAYSATPTIPAVYKNYKAWFRTTHVTRIAMYSSCEFFKIVDGAADFGGVLADFPDNPADKFASLVAAIQKKVDLLDEELPVNTPFPDYISFLKLAKSFGIPTYILNTVIASLERRESVEPTFVLDDWGVYKDPAILKKERTEAKKLNQKRYDVLGRELTSELAQIKRRRAGLIFEVSGNPTQEGYNHIMAISKELDALASLEDDVKVGTVGYAESAYRRALIDSKARKGHNLKAGAILAAVVAAAIFVAYSIMTAKKSNEAFETAITEMEELVEDGQFKEGEAHMAEAFSAYKPAYLQFTKKRSLRACNSYINRAIDEFVDERVEQISSFIQANYGRIDDFTWDLIKECMEFRPDDERLLEFRERYIAQ